MLVAIAIGQKVGAAKMMTADSGHRRHRQHDHAALGARHVDRGADRGLQRYAEKSAAVVTSPTSVCVQCWPVTR